MIFVILFLGFLFLGIGFLLTVHNASSLLAGYNTMSEAERRSFDLEGYVPFFRRFHRWLGLSFLSGALLLHYFGDVDAAGVFVGVYPILAYIYFLWASRRFYRAGGAAAGGSESDASPDSGTTGQDSAPAGSDSASAGSDSAPAAISKTASTIGIWVLVGTLILVVGLMIAGFKEDRLTIQAGSGVDSGPSGRELALKFSGMYGETIPLSDIQSVTLLDTLPRITFRESGFALGRASKGYFRAAGPAGSSGSERVKLILNTKTPPYLLITKTNGRKIYYTARSVSTAGQYAELKALLGK